MATQNSNPSNPSNPSNATATPAPAPVHNATAPVTLPALSRAQRRLMVHLQYGYACTWVQGNHLAALTHTTAPAVTVNVQTIAQLHTMGLITHINLGNGQHAYRLSARVAHPVYQWRPRNPGRFAHPPKPVLAAAAAHHGHVYR